MTVSASNPLRSTTRGLGTRRLAITLGTVAVIGAAGLWAWSRVPSREAAVGTAPVRADAARIEPAQRPTRVVGFADGCMTAECHTRMGPHAQTGAKAHAAACASCHQPDQGGHVYPVVDRIGAVCTACHTVGAGVQHAHSTRPGIDCTSCHATHAGHGAALLRADGLAKTCEQCHPAGHTSVTLHEGDNRCDVCHDMHHSPIRRHLRSGTDADSCTDCHDTRLVSAGHFSPGHARLEDACSACHSEHVGVPTARLRDEPARVCLSCHADIRDALLKDPNSPDTRIMIEACTRCHDAHHAGRSAMMRTTERDACLACHSKEVHAADGRVIREATSVQGAPHLHGPVAEARCGACHVGHGGRHTARADLLAHPSPAHELDARGAVHCFACHDPALALSEGEYATAFRSDSRNLHAVHLKADAGRRGCTSCHAPHGSRGPHLIAETARFDGSDWEMPIRFTKTDTGGSCAPGCHAPMGYSRSGDRAASPPDGGVR